MNVTDGQIDGQTDTHTRALAALCIASCDNEDDDDSFANCIRYLFTVINIYKKTLATVIVLKAKILYSFATFIPNLIFDSVFVSLKVFSRSSFLQFILVLAFSSLPMFRSIFLRCIFSRPMVFFDLDLQLSNYFIGKAKFYISV